MFRRFSALGLRSPATAAACRGIKYCSSTGTSTVSAEAKSPPDRNSAFAPFGFSQEGSLSEAGNSTHPSSPSVLDRRRAKLVAENLVEKAVIDNVFGTLEDMRNTLNTVDCSLDQVSHTVGQIEQVVGSLSTLQGRLIAPLVIGSLSEVIGTALQRVSVVAAADPKLQQAESLPAGGRTVQAEGLCLRLKQTSQVLMKHLQRLLGDQHKGLAYAYTDAGRDFHHILWMFYSLKDYPSLLRHWRWMSQTKAYLQTEARSAVIAAYAAKNDVGKVIECCDELANDQLLLTVPAQEAVLSMYASLIARNSGGAAGEDGEQHAGESAGGALRQVGLSEDDIWRHTLKLLEYWNPTSLDHLLRVATPALLACQEAGALATPEAFSLVERIRQTMAAGTDDSAATIKEQFVIVTNAEGKPHVAQCIFQVIALASPDHATDIEELFSHFYNAILNEKGELVCKKETLLGAIAACAVVCKQASVLDEVARAFVNSHIQLQSALAEHYKHLHECDWTSVRDEMASSFRVLLLSMVQLLRKEHYRSGNIAVETITSAVNEGLEADRQQQEELSRYVLPAALEPPADVKSRLLLLHQEAVGRRGNIDELLDMHLN